MEKKKNSRLSRMMRVSWEIQRRRNKTRSKALEAAWAIFNNEDITVYYLVSKLSSYKPVKQKDLNQMGLFKQ